MNIDYDDIIPKILTAMFPNEEERKRAIIRLEDYGVENWQVESQRVRLAILNLTYDSPEKFDEIVDCACEDYRDVLYFAESPLTIVEDWGLKEENPTLFRLLSEADELNYMNWIKQLTTA